MTTDAGRAHVRTYPGHARAVVAIEAEAAQRAVEELLARLPEAIRRSGYEMEWVGGEYLGAADLARAISAELRKPR